MCTHFTALCETLQLTAQLTLSRHIKSLNDLLCSRFKVFYFFSNKKFIRSIAIAFEFFWSTWGSFIKKLTAQKNTPLIRSQRSVIEEISSKATQPLLTVSTIKAKLISTEPDYRLLHPISFQLSRKLRYWPAYQYELLPLFFFGDIDNFFGCY